MKAGAWKRRQAVAAARWASPAHGRHAAVALWRVGTARRSTEAGRAREVGWARRGAGERQARWQAEPASAVGREARKFQIAVFKYPFEQENDFF